jgi:hypothetical protein
LSVEILDQGATSWRNGPQLPINIGYGAMVEDPLGEFYKSSEIFLYNKKGGFFKLGYHFFKLAKI